ncbi:Protein SUP-1 [Aphelenchoides avenae]|nr:Protein SUP-1 [Aphelenchus avenae]
MSTFTLASLASTCLIAAVMVLSFAPQARADDFDLKNKAGSKICVGKICDDSSAFHYYECCGDLYNDCCFRLQTWVIVVLVVLGVLFLLSVVGGILRWVCNCCR